MSEDRTGQILKLLNELINLVKTNQPKVENHTHHHYPTNPNNWYYPTTSPWFTGSNAGNTPMVTSGGYFQPGSTTTWSTNDPPENGTDTPSE